MVARCDLAILAPYLPAPLQIDDAGVVHLSALDLVSDCGLEPNFVLENPDLSQVKEAVIGVMTRHNGEPAYWSLYLWTDNDAEIAVGREMYGWRQRRGEISISRQPFRGWQAGEVVTGLASRGHRSLFEMRVELERAGDIPGECGQPPAFPLQAEANLYFTETIQMHPVDLTVARRLVGTVMEDVVVQNLWSGPVAFRPFADELQFLADATPIGGRCHELAWKKPWANSVIREGTVAP